MKSKVLIAASLLISWALQAQETAPQARDVNPDSLINRFCLDLNLMGGTQFQSITMASTTNGYHNSLNANISAPTYTMGTHFGADMQAGFFLGQKRNWGIGAGLMFLSQSGTLTIDQYQIEYQSVDFKNDIFRQVISAQGAVKENISTTSLQVPVVAKYRHQLNQHWGIAADLGVLASMLFRTHYSTSSAFNYEAIYQYNTSGKAVYDASSVPDVAKDWMITQSEYNKTDPQNGAASHFATLAAQGYNVGLGKGPRYTSGDVSYKKPVFGLVFKPTVTYKVTPGFYLDLGVNYLLQQTANNATNYNMVGKVGAYTTMVLGEKNMWQHTLGANVGARFYFNRRQDRDGDGVVDRNDKCPDLAGLRQFDGCPDTDHDGITDNVDSCPREFGLIQFNGCPDSDGDGVPDKADRCPKQAGVATLLGCPDADGDGIPDIDDHCPLAAGPLQFAGCPDTDGDGIPDFEDNCPNIPGVKEYHGCPVPEQPVPQQPTKQKEVTIIETKSPQTATGNVKDLYEVGAPILFDVNSFEIKESSMATLTLAVEELKNEKTAHIRVDAYTDGTGSDELNNALSVKRADAVKHRLVKMGADPTRITAKGHGKKDPVAPNNTAEGREKNRRTILSMEHR